MKVTHHKRQQVSQSGRCVFVTAPMPRLIKQKGTEQMNERPPIFTSGSLAPASIASRIRLWLKQNKKKAANLRWSLRVLSSGGFDNENKKKKAAREAPFFFSDHDTKAMLCVDLGQGGVDPISWMEIPGDINKETGAKKTARFKLSEFTQIIALSERQRANLRWRRAASTGLSAVPVTVKLMGKLGEVIDLPWGVEAAAAVGVAKACIFEARTAVLFVHPTQTWAVLEIPQVSYWIIDAILEHEHAAETKD